MRWLQTITKHTLIQLLKSLEFIFGQIILGGSFIFGLFTLFCAIFGLLNHLINGASQNPQQFSPGTMFLYSIYFFIAAGVSITLFLCCFTLRGKLEDNSQNKNIKS
jgi:heme/copper-type cytochrome/quinol oxidase subunit 2